MFLFGWDGGEARIGVARRATVADDVGGPTLRRRGPLYRARVISIPRGMAGCKSVGQW